jgi:poly-gamma-glutamate system protein
MKKMYWRPRRVSRTALVLISVSSVAGYASLERFPTKVQEPYHQEKMAAAQLTREAFEALRKERLRRRLPIDTESDIAQTGLIGTLVTPITTNTGSLMSKQTSVNPNFSSVILHYLKQAGVQEGDAVAIGYSGSFPAINVAVLAAVETLKAKPVIISSASSSQWGANEPEFSWLDMEKTLYDQGIITSRSVAASVGGIEDRGLGMTKRGRRILHQKIAEHGLQLIDPENFLASVEERMQIYRQHAGASPIRAYINVGGGTTSVGRKAGKLAFKPGLNRSAPTGATIPLDSVMGRFIGEGVPVIHMIKILRLAETYGFPWAPTSMPLVGEGKIFHRERTNAWFAGGLLLSIMIALYLFVRSDLGFRMTRISRRGGDSSHPEPMV